MPLTYNGKQLNNNDVQAIKLMLRDTLEANLDYYRNEYLNSAIGRGNDTSSRLISDVFSNALNGLDRRIDTAHKSRTAVNPTDLMSGIFSDISKGMISAAESKELSDQEKNDIKDTFEETGSKELIDYLSFEVHTKNTDAGYSVSESGFHLATEPIEGVEDIAEYNPNSGRVQVLYEARSGNSSTLKNSVEDVQKQLEEIPEGDTKKRSAAQKKLDTALQSTTGLRAAGETARIHSAELMSKKEVSFGDLYNVFSDLNKQVRIGDPNGGKLRARGVTAGKIDGISSFSIPKDVFKTLNTVADAMNRIKKTENEALRKTQAIQLASFAYNMTLGEHVFKDGNGRTCRMFADTILQTFGLPPHTPQEELKGTADTIGFPMDFDKGARAFLQGVRQSDQILRQEKERIRQLPGEKERLGAQVSSLEGAVNKLASEAKAKLGELDSLAKDGHKNGREYTEMYNALKAVSELDPSKNDVRSVQEAVKRLSETSKEYERTHTGWFKGRSEFGLARKNISIDLQKIADFRKEVINGFSKDLDKNTVISGLHPEGMSAAKVQEAKTEKIKKLDLNAVEKKEKEANPEFGVSQRKRSNSVSIKRPAANSKTTGNSRSRNSVIPAPKQKKMTGP